MLLLVREAPASAWTRRRGLLFAARPPYLNSPQPMRITKYEWGLVKMAEGFEHKYVGLVAGIIGLVVLVLGFAGILMNLFVT